MSDVLQKRVISNKVYTEIQTPSQIIQDETGTILYANRYSGISPVPMPDEFAEIFNSDYGEVGNNILVQLQQKVQNLPDGPWYVDSIDDIIYIHNRKLQEESVETYTYYQEDGQLLNISFETQYITKTIQGNTFEGIGPDKSFNTDSVANYTGYFEGTDKESVKRGAYKVYRDYINGKLPWDVMNNTIQYLSSYNADPRHGTKILFTEDQSGAIYARKALDENNAKIKRKKALEEEYIHSYQAAGGDKPVSKNWTKGSRHTGSVSFFRKLNEADLEALGREVDHMISHEYVGVRDIELAKKEIEEAIKTGTLEEHLKKHYNDLVVLRDPNNQLTPEVGVVETVDPRKYVTASDRKKIENYRAQGKSVVEVDNLTSILGYNHLKSQEGVHVITESAPQVNTYTDEYGNPLVTNGGLSSKYYQVKIYRKKKSKTMTVPKWRVMLAYYTRRSKVGTGNIGPKDIEQRIWSAANVQRKITERKLVCRMICVGNPKLQKSQVIQILNVGNRWSGYWYIKSCTHQLSPSSGYTCQLELVKNSGIGNSSGAGSGITMDGGMGDSTLSEKNNGGETGYKLTTLEFARYSTLKSDIDKDMFYIRAQVEAEKGGNGHGIVKRGGNYYTGMKSSDKEKVTLVVTGGHAPTKEEIKKYGRAAKAYREKNTPRK